MEYCTPATVALDALILATSCVPETARRRVSSDFRFSCVCRARLVNCTQAAGISAARIMGPEGQSPARAFACVGKLEELGIDCGSRLIAARAQFTVFRRLTPACYLVELLAGFAIHSRPNAALRRREALNQQGPGPNSCFGQRLDYRQAANFRGSVAPEIFTGSCLNRNPKLVAPLCESREEPKAWLRSRRAADHLWATKNRRVSPVEPVLKLGLEESLWVSFHVEPIIHPEEEFKHQPVNVLEQFVLTSYLLHSQQFLFCASGFYEEFSNI